MSASASTATAATKPAPWTTVNKIGLVLSIIFGVLNVASVFSPTPAGEVGPPFEILLADTALSVVVIAATVVAWVRGSRLAARLAAVGIALITLSALPAFFVDVPAAIKALVGFITLFSVVTIVMMLAPAKRSPSN